MVAPLTENEVRYQNAALADENARLWAFAMWVDSWVSNPVGAYSVAALDGLFSMTRDRLAVIADSDGENMTESKNG